MERDRRLRHHRFFFMKPGWVISISRIVVNIRIPIPGPGLRSFALPPNGSGVVNLPDVLAWPRCAQAGQGGHLNAGKQFFL